MLRRKGKLELNPESEFSHENEREDLELPLFDFIAIAKATNSFSINNKLGEGGFRPVYKVKLKQGLKIAMSISGEGNAYLQVLKQLNMPPDTQVSLTDEKGDIEKAKIPWEILPTNHKIGTPVPLFKELADKDVEFFRGQFAGSQANRIVKAEAEAKQIAEQLKRTKVSGCLILKANFLQNH